jgi:hypothetical protein
MRGHDEIVATNYSDFADLAKAAIARMDDLGVPHRQTRFEAYAAYLDEATRRVYPRPIRWDEHRLQLVYEIEAISQSLQLAIAVSLQGKVDNAALVRRLQQVVRGPELPPSEDDRARDVLLELTTAFLLIEQAFTVELPRSDDEDLVLRVPDAPALAVECKRPASERSIKNSVKKARRQLFERRRRYPDGGMVVLGLDRVVGLSGKLGRVERPEEIPGLVREALQDCATEACIAGGAKLAAVCPVLMTVMAGVVFSTEPAQPIVVLRTGSSRVPGARGAVASVLMSAFEPGGGATPNSILAQLRG